ncbi:MAG: HAD family hydrolase [Gammaproteobacteria bacterium]|nr:HAD family hydrolase [Gammaproteobacteria bacterium]
MARPKKIEICVCYDFDGTLIWGNMQENSFIPDIGMSPDKFWQDAKKKAKSQDMDEVLAYMQLMIEKVIEKARDAEKPLTRQDIIAHGQSLKYFPGVEAWFKSINDYGKETGATIKHFVISSGLLEMIKGSKIARNFESIFASGFSYDANNVPKFATRSVNFTTKTQYLYRINKKVLNSWDSEAVNRFTPDAERPNPFSRMIYIGDGETDVPAMKTLNYQGGYSIAVYPPKKGARRTKAEQEKKETAEKLVTQNRAKFVAEADFRKDKQLYKIVTGLIRRIVDESVLKMNLNAK